ncbi:MAG TPA: hypothetical protein VMV72_16100 [Verrucomicrobiae bacterium]|nr:hypothetical protein [Verrucomicrobiae bacterium]
MKPPHRKLHLLLALSVWCSVCIYAHPGTLGFAELSLSIVRFHTFRIDHYANLNEDQSYVNGHYYYGRPPGYSFLAMPAALVVHGVWEYLVPEGVKTTIGREVAARYANDPKFLARVALKDLTELILVSFLSIATVSSVSVALLALLVQKFLTDRGLSELDAVCVAAAAILGSLLGVFAASNSNQVVATTLAFWSFHRLHSGMARSVSWLTAMITGLALASSLVLEYQAVLICGIIGCYALYALAPARRVPFAIGTMVPVILVMAYNGDCFGSPFVTAYRFPSGAGHWGTHELHRSGFLGMGWPRLDSLVAFLVSTKVGYFVFMPATIGGIIYAVAAARRNQEPRIEAIVALAAFLLYWIGSSTAAPEFAGTVFGPRFMIMSIPFVMLCTGLAVRAWPRGKSLARSSMILSVAICFVGLQYPMPMKAIGTASNLFTEVYWPLMKQQFPYNLSIDYLGHLFRWGRLAYLSTNLLILFALIAVWAALVRYARRLDAESNCEPATKQQPQQMLKP